MNTSIKHLKQAYYWAHFGTGDTMSQAIGRNVPRVRSQRADSAKSGPLSVIARDEQTFNDLTAAKEQIGVEVRRQLKDAVEVFQGGTQAHKKVTDMRRNLKRRLDPNYAPKGVLLKTRSSFDKSILRTSESDLKLYRALTSAKKSVKSLIVKGAKQKLFFLEKEAAILGTKIRIASAVDMDTLDPKNTKLYVIGHGIAGEAFISPTTSANDCISLSVIASGLADVGLPVTFEDVRLISCYSADAKIPAAFTPGSNPHGGIFGFSQAHAPAQVLSNEMAQHGFEAIRVTGYHGAGIRQPAGLHKLRTLEEKSPTSSAVRASTVKKVFTPQK